MSANTPENRIKRKLDRVLKKLGVWYYCPQSGPFGARGIPDRVAIISGTFVGIECKADKSKKLTALQKKCGLEIEKAGGVFFVAYDDETIKDVEDFINFTNGG